MHTPVILRHHVHTASHFGKFSNVPNPTKILIAGKMFLDSDADKVEKIDFLVSSYRRVEPLISETEALP